MRKVMAELVRLDGYGPGDLIKILQQTKWKRMNTHGPTQYFPGFRFVGYTLLNRQANIYMGFYKAKLTDITDLAYPVSCFETGYLNFNVPGDLKAQGLPGLTICNINLTDSLSKFRENADYRAYRFTMET